MLRLSVLTVVSVVVSLGVVPMTGVGSIYLPSNATSSRVAKSKTNSLDEVHLKRYSNIFKDDREIARYVKMYGVDLMIWRCKNAIQPYWNSKPLSYVELYCEVIGTMKYVTWYHNSRKLIVGRGTKYTHLVSPHHERGHYYSRWIDFRLRVYNATRSDAGVYTFSATSPSGFTSTQAIYVDISDKRKRAPVTASAAALMLDEDEFLNAVPRNA